MLFIKELKFFFHHLIAFERFAGFLSFILYPSFCFPRQDEDLQEMRQSAVQIDQQYGHLVDRVLIKEDSASACAELRSILERLERESFWVPLNWVRT